MPPRLSKRQQRELEELEALKQTTSGNSSHNEDEDEIVAGPSKASFANFLMPDDDDEGEEETALKAKKSKKKKRKPVSEQNISPAPAKLPVKPSTPVPPARNEKKAQKKARAKEKKAANDELEQALAELSVQYPPSQKISQAEAGKSSLADLLSVSLQHLDAEAEMRRFFGSRVVQATRSEGSSNRKKAPAVKSNLTRPQPTWWAAKGREGLSLRPLSDDETADLFERHGWGAIQEKWWTVEYSKKYKGITKAFMDAVLSGDPQGLFDLLGALPWHADTLLQLSEIYRHRDEHAQAVDFIERALFTYERAFIGAFTFTTGLNRLDFDYVENRPFFLAIHRQVVDLQRRGCIRTAFEFARLLYSLDPWSDPHGSSLHLDFIAIKAGMHQWFLDIYDIFVDRRVTTSEDVKSTRLDPSILPGWAYAKALALRISEQANKDKDHTKSTEALKEAARDFPSIVPLLADKLDVSLPANIRGHRDLKIMTDNTYLSAPNAVLHLLSHLYVQRSSPIWKDHSAWFESTIMEEFSSLPSSLPSTHRRNAFLTQFENKNFQYSIYRHIMVLESSYRRLFSFIPRQILDVKSLSCDPLPPLTALTQYDQHFFQGLEELFSTRRHRSRRQRAMDERRFAQMIPDAAFRQQMQAFFDGNPQFAERFPGGILQFAQMAGQLPPDMLEDLMMIEAMGNGHNNNINAVQFDFGNGNGLAMGGDFDGNDVPLPGNFPEVRIFPIPEHLRPPRGDFDIDEEPEDAGSSEDDGEDDEDEDMDVSPMPRFLRNILGRFLGRGNAQEDESSEDEDEAPQPRDDLGVD